MLDFPSAPAIGDTFTSGDRTYTWTGNRWAMQYASADPAALLPHLPSGRRNLLINGNFNIWQRGTSFTALGFTADRWLWNHRPGGAGEVSQIVHPAGQTDVPGDPPYYIRVTQTVLPTSSLDQPNFRQLIEDVRTLAGRQATLSFYTYGDAATQLDVRVDQNFGSGGSASVLTTVASTTTGNGAWKKHVLSFTVPDITGKTVDSGSYVGIQFSFPATELFVVRFGAVQFEAGSVATPFDRRSFGDELAFCQRYFYKTTSGIWGPTYLSDRAICSVWYPMPMRAVPTAAFSTDRTIGSSFVNQITTQYYMQAQFTGTTWVAVLAGATFDAEL